MAVPKRRKSRSKRDTRRATHKISAKAKEKIEAAGGSVTLIEVAEPVKTKRNKAKLNAAKRAASATTEKSED